MSTNDIRAHLNRASAELEAAVTHTSEGTEVQEKINDALMAITDAENAL